MLRFCGTVCQYAIERIRNPKMDWTFYAVVFAVLFAIVAILLSLRFILNRRIDRAEERRRKKEEARQIAETNSGL